MHNNRLEALKYKRTDHNLFVARAKNIITSLPRYDGLRELAEEICWGNVRHTYGRAYGIGYVQALIDSNSIKAGDVQGIYRALDQCRELWSEYMADEMATIHLTGGL